MQVRAFERYILLRTFVFFVRTGGYNCHGGYKAGMYLTLRNKYEL